MRSETRSDSTPTVSICGASPPAMGQGPPRGEWTDDRRFLGYRARAVPNGPDDGTLAPWALVASLPFAPEIVLPTLQHCLDRYPTTLKAHGLVCSINPTFPGTPGRRGGWISRALRARSGSGRPDDRKLPLRPVVAAHAALSLRRGWAPSGRLQPWLADWRSGLKAPATWPCGRACFAVTRASIGGWDRRPLRTVPGRRRASSLRARIGPGRVGNWRGNPQAAPWPCPGFPPACLSPIAQRPGPGSAIFRDGDDIQRRHFVDVPEKNVPYNESKKTASRRFSVRTDAHVRARQRAGASRAVDRERRSRPGVHRRQHRHL
jgi:hypothetical protein